MVHENHPMKSGIKRTQRDYMLAFKLSVVNLAPRAPGEPGDIQQLQEVASCSERTWL
jgi:hypothetical protein